MDDDSSMTSSLGIPPRNTAGMTLNAETYEFGGDTGGGGGGGSGLGGSAGASASGGSDPMRKTLVQRQSEVTGNDPMARAEHIIIESEKSAVKLRTQREETGENIAACDRQVADLMFQINEFTRMRADVQVGLGRVCVCVCVCVCVLFFSSTPVQWM